jgi:protein-tyrosine phosphatase
MSRILFLCTGNYYRSRFAEEYFNHHAVRHGVRWRADSKGLARDLAATDNKGPISRFALAQLAVHGIPSRGVERWPARVEAADFLRYPRVVALSRLEHEPMMHEYFPEHVELVEYLEIGDVNLESPERAIARLATHLDVMVKALRRT